MEIRVRIDRTKILKRIEDASGVDVSESIDTFTEMLGDEIALEYSFAPFVIYEEENEKHELIDFEFLGESTDEAGDDAFMQFVIEKAHEILASNDWVVLENTTKMVN
jgi:hypothetical protein